MVKLKIHAILSFLKTPKVRTVKGFSGLLLFYGCNCRARSQSKRATNCTTPRYMVGRMGSAHSQRAATQGEIRSFLEPPCATPRNIRCFCIVLHFCCKVKGSLSVLTDEVVLVVWARGIVDIRLRRSPSSFPFALVLRPQQIASLHTAGTQNSQGSITSAITKTQKEHPSRTC